MAINPMDENEDDEEDEESGDHGGMDPQQYLLGTDLPEAEIHAAMQDLECATCMRAPTADGCEDPPNLQEAVIVDHAPVRSASPTVAMSRSLYDGAPRLELSISEADLDLLISSLPSSSTPGDSNSMNGEARNNNPVDSKDNGASSEMQWVLSFLTDPDDIASHDAEAKSLLQNLEKHDDDNYQYFLQELNQANLLLANPSGAESCANEEEAHTQFDGKLASHPKGLASTDATDALAQLKVSSKSDEDRQAEEIEEHTTDDDHDSENQSEEEEEESGEDEDWALVRQSMKDKATRQTVPTRNPSISMTSLDTHRHTTANLCTDMPPPAPASASDSRGVENIYDGNSRRRPQNQRAALSREIGDLLKTHGEFQFPKHLFPHHNDDLDVEG